jgi:hypothetical protein
MAWEARHAGRQRYFYKSLRIGKRVKKVYFGRGAAGQVAAEAEVARRQKQRAEALAWIAKRTKLESLFALQNSFVEVCELLAVATLLVAGFHRVKRSHWRPWHAGRNTLKGTH